MRNLKKILALVLALVMTFGLMSVAGAAFKDQASITANYTESVEVMNGMGILKGYTDGTFKPAGNITRAEMAAIIYRITTGDVKDLHVNLYNEGANFTDTKGHWASSYIGYCATKGYIFGYEDGSFRPNNNVTGYEAVIMLLRAVGYNKTNIFTGSNWKLLAASYAEENDITDTLVNYSLNNAASREVIAEMTFNTLYYAHQVSYTPAGGYSKLQNVFQGTGFNPTLGTEVFGLARTTWQDDWGRPGYKWYDATGVKGYATYLTRAAQPTLTYNTAVAECDIAKALGWPNTLDYAETFEFWANGDKITYTSGYGAANEIRARDYSDMIGAQGRQVLVYDGYNVVVMIDTFLGKVDAVKAAAYDYAGHKTKDAYIDVIVYDGTNHSSTIRIYDAAAESWNYSKGDMVLLNAWTAATNDQNASGYVDKTANGEHSRSEFYQGDNAIVLGVAESFVGNQTFIHWLEDKHTVNGTEYMDAVEFHLDEAGRETNAHTWYLDQFGNMIGVTDIANVYTYGVIKNMWWAGNAADGTGLAKATVVYMDGTSAVVTLGSVNTNGLTYANSENAMIIANNTLYVATDINVNAGKDVNNIIEDNMFRFFVDANGYVHANNVNATTGIVLGTTTSNIVNGRPENNDPLVNSNTIFLINKGYGVYTSVTDYNMVGTWLNGDVDYLMGGTFAKYVYINAATTPSTYTASIFAPATVGYGYDAVKNQYVIYGYVDGSETATEVRVDVALDAAAIVAQKAVMLKITNGLVVDTTAVVDGETFNGYWTGWTNATYGNCTTEIIAAGVSKTLSGNVLTDGTDSWNVTTATTPGYDSPWNSNVVYLIVGTNGYTAYSMYIL